MGCEPKPLGRRSTDPSPVDRGKQGTKRSVLTDQRGIRLAVQITGANTPDKTGALATLDSMVVERPKKGVYRLLSEGLKATPKKRKSAIRTIF